MRFAGVDGSGRSGILGRDPLPPVHGTLQRPPELLTRMLEQTVDVGRQNHDCLLKDSGQGDHQIGAAGTRSGVDEDLAAAGRRNSPVGGRCTVQGDGRRGGAGR